MLSARGLGLMCGVAFGFGVASADAATISLRAVKRNGGAIPATNNLSIIPNDEVEADIFVSGWGNEIPSPDGVRLFQTGLLGVAGFQSGDNGVVLPNGWQSSLTPIECTVDADCTADARYPICGDPRTGCRAAGHDPDLGAFITLTRPDYLFSGLSSILGVDNSSLNYRYFALAETGRTVDTGVPRYVGTLVMRTSANACGVFTVGFNNSDSESFLANFDNTIQIALTSQPLVLTVGSCALQLLDCDPDHCFTDSRIPHQPDNAAAKLTMNQFVAHFSGPTTGLAAANFQITQIPPVGPLPAFASFTNVGNDSSILLNLRLNKNVYTCVRHILSNKQCCFGVLPGDADSSLRTQPVDTFELIDNLDGEVLPRLLPEKCDVDRSFLCTAADLLMEVDLLNGAGAFVPYNDASLPVCPNMVIR